MVRRSSNIVEVKGYGNDINIILNDEVDFSEVEAELIRRLEGSDQFFSGLEIVLDVGDRVLGLDDCKRLKGVLCDRFHLTITKVKSRANETRKIVEQIGWKLEDRRLRKGKVESSEVMPVGGVNDTILLEGTLRSGQRKWHRGNIVIIGDVNPGAEVVATGNIVVVGTLRGVAHAGATGDISTKIIALSLQPIQLRIAGYIGRAPDLGPEKGNVPEVARIEDGNIVIRKLK